MAFGTNFIIYFEAMNDISDLTFMKKYIAHHCLLHDCMSNTAANVMKKCSYITYPQSVA